MTPSDWRRIMVAFAIIAVAWAIGGFIAARNYTQIRHNQDHLENLAVNVTASLCLQAYAPETGANNEASLAQRYVEDLPIPLTNDVCKRALAKSREQVKGD